MVIIKTGYSFRNTTKLFSCLQCQCVILFSVFGQFILIYLQNIIHTLEFWGWGGIIQNTYSVLTTYYALRYHSQRILEDLMWFWGSKQIGYFYFFSYKLRFSSKYELWPFFQYNLLLYIITREDIYSNINLISNEYYIDLYCDV